MNEIPAQRGTTPTDSFTDNIVLSGSTAVRSAIRATGKDQQEDQKKGYLLTLMSSFDNPSLHDGRNKGILPSDEVISVADEKDGHSVSLLFLSFNQERFDCRFAREFFLSIPETRHDLLHHLFPLTLVLPFSIHFQYHLIGRNQWCPSSF